MKPPASSARLYRSTVFAHLATATAALMLAGALLLVFEFLSARQQFLSDLQAQVRVIALNSAAAVVFGDAHAAGETLAALDALSHLQASAIVDGSGTVLAQSRRAGQEELAVPHGAAGAQASYGVRQLQIVEPIHSGGQVVGRVIVRSGLDRLYGRMITFAGAFLIAGLGALALSYPLMSRMRGQVKAAEARLDHLAHFDPVTGLLNRNAFNEHLQSLAASGVGDRRQLGLVLLDLDNFKGVNDSLGHQLGDELLRQVAQRLAMTVRGNDKVFRLGGDEFAVVLFPVETAAQASAAAQRLLDQLARPFRIDTHELDAAASAGVSLYPKDAGTMQALASHADTAMYLAKRNGKNRFEMFRPEMIREVHHRMRLRSDLRRALDQEQFRLDYQVQVSCRDLHVTGIEALLRWDHPDLGPVSPAEFIPLAEESGLIVPLGNWVIDAACRQSRAWRDAGLPAIRMAVNVSTRQMRGTQLLDAIETTLAAHRLAPDDLELEITESMLLENVEANIELLGRLRALGVHLAIDDFGTGYSSMAYLQQLPIERLKIDRSFVRHIPGDGEVITAAIVAMAHQLGVAVLAEGVETEAQLDFLARAGCDDVQGFWLSRPLPALPATDLLSRLVGGDRVAPFSRIAGLRASNQWGRG